MRDQVKACEFRRLPYPHLLTVSKDRDPVRNLINLIEKVCDKNDSKAFRPEPPHDPEELGNFGGVQARSRLVENEDPRRDVERTGNRNHLLNSDRATA